MVSVRRSIRSSVFASAAALALWGVPAAGLFALQGCAAAKQLAVYPSARIATVDFEGLSLTGVNLRFDVEVDNPYGVELPLLGIDYAIASEGKTFLEGTLDAARSIPARSSDVVPLQVRLPFLELYSVIDGARSKTEIPYEADMALKVRAPVLGIVSLPLKESGVLPLR